jgi:hypothetical protein
MWGSFMNTRSFVITPLNTCDTLYKVTLFLKVNEEAEL